MWWWWWCWGVVVVMWGSLAGAGVPPAHTPPTDTLPCKRRWEAPSSFPKPGQWEAVGRL